MAAERWGGIAVEVTVPLAAFSLEVSFRTESSAVALVGPSGSGKSTLLRVLAGLERSARGSVSFDGESWLDTAAGAFVQPWDRGVGWVPQHDLLFPHLSVRENLGYAGASDAEVRELAELLAVDQLLERRPRRLSGGERQRVALGRALLAEPRLVLLDEPFAALDPALRGTVSRTVRSLLEERGIPSILVSHDERDAQALSDERWMLTRGRIRKLDP